MAVIQTFKVQGFFICHIIHYTGYNQKCLASLCVVALQEYNRYDMLFFRLHTRASQSPVLIMGISLLCSTEKDHAKKHALQN